MATTIKQTECLLFCWHFISLFASLLTFLRQIFAYLRNYFSSKVHFFLQFKLKAMYINMCVLFFLNFQRQANWFIWLMKWTLLFVVLFFFIYKCISQKPSAHKNPNIDNGYNDNAFGITVAYKIQCGILLNSAQLLEFAKKKTAVYIQHDEKVKPTRGNTLTSRSMGGVQLAKRKIKSIK